MMLNFKNNSGVINEYKLWFQDVALVASSSSSSSSSGSQRPRQVVMDFVQREGGDKGTMDHSIPTLFITKRGFHGIRATTKSTGQTGR